MASQGANILRFGALGGGVFYGWRHQSTLSEKSKLYQAERERVHHANLVEKAHEEYLKRKNPKTGNGVITDPDDSRFDLEAYLNMVAAESP